MKNDENFHLKLFGEIASWPLRVLPKLYLHSLRFKDIYLLIGVFRIHLKEHANYIPNRESKQ